MRQPRCAFTQLTERELGPAVARDAAAAAGWAKQSGAMLMIRERLKQPYLMRQLNNAIKSTEAPNLKLVTCGRATFNLLEGAGPAALRCILEHLGAMFDVVLVDSPPVALGSPAEAISEMVGGTVLVVQADRFEAAVIRRAKDRLEKRGARVLGVILNQVDLQQPDQSFHYYYLYYPAAPEGNGSAARRRRGRPQGVGANEDLPAALRARLEEEAELESIGVRPASPAPLLAVALVAVLVLGAFFLIRFGPWSQPRSAVGARGAAPSAAASTAGVPATQAESAPALAPLDSPSVAHASPGDSSKASTAAVAASTTAAASSSAAAAAPARRPHASPSQQFTISVGTFLESDRAGTELRKIESVTLLPTRVLRVSEGGDDSYRVVVGRFASRAEAEKAASDLMDTGQVREAMVLPVTGAANH